MNTTPISKGWNPLGAELGTHSELRYHLICGQANPQFDRLLFKWEEFDEEIFARHTLGGSDLVAEEHAKLVVESYFGFQQLTEATKQRLSSKQLGIGSKEAIDFYVCETGAGAYTKVSYPDRNFEGLSADDKAALQLIYVYINVFSEDCNSIIRFITENSKDGGGHGLPGIKVIEVQEILAFVQSRCFSGHLEAFHCQSSEP